MVIIIDIFFQSVFIKLQTKISRPPENQHIVRYKDDGVQGVVGFLLLSSALCSFSFLLFMFNFSSQYSCALS